MASNDLKHKKEMYRKWKPDQTAKDKKEQHKIMKKVRKDKAQI